jgi:fatty-acyl-CoA synthase
MFHVNAWGLPYAAWMTGADLVMPGRHLKSPALADLITETRPTIAVAVPTVWTGLAEHARADPRVDFRSLRLAISGGSAMPLRLVREMGQLGVIMTQGWGMTETSPLVAYTKTPAGTDPSDVQQWTIQAGQIIPGVKIRLTDDSGHVLPWDGITVGELEMRGPTIAAAYHGLAASDEKFRDGWLRSGDLGSISPRGWVRIHDRLKDGIKSGGEWISTPDLESAILEHPAIRESMVFGIPDPKWQERPLACVVLQPGHSDLPEDIEDFLASRVAKFWIPQQWAVVSSVPKTTVGKLDKKSMRKRFEEGGFEVITAHGPPTASI